VRQQAIHALLDRQIAPPGCAAREQAVRATIRALGDPVPGVRWEAARSLIAAGHGAEALPILVRDLEDSQLKSHRSDTVWCLSRMGTEAAGAIPALQEALRETTENDLPSRISRVEAASILVRLGVEGEALAVLQKALDDQVPYIQRIARQALECHEPGIDRVATPE
jgi:HEAT repeat protein